MLRIFQFTGDSAGNPDDIILPSDCNGTQRCLEIYPPFGHAWTIYPSNSISIGIGMGVDQSFYIERTREQQPFQPGEKVGAVALDTGSGTFKGRLW